LSLVDVARCLFQDFFTGYTPAGRFAAPSLTRN
jgi:hypothetical protein